MGTKLINQLFMSKELKQKIKANSISELIYKAAQKLNINISILGELKGRPIFSLKKNGQRTYLRATATMQGSYLGKKIARSKILSHRLLKENGFPVPEQVEVESKKDLQDLLDTYNKIVLKPYDGCEGKKVTTDIESLQEAWQVVKEIKKDHKKVIAEEQVPGRDYRVLVVGNRISAVAERIPAWVVGNGQDNIEQLIKKENNSEKRSKKGAWRPIKFNSQVKRFLKKQDLGLDYIPKKEEKVTLTRAANVSAGGIAVNVTDEICPANKKIALDIASIMGLDVTGLDFKTPHISQPLEKSGGRIVEVNGLPDLTGHFYIARGEPVNPAEDILKMLTK